MRQYQRKRVRINVSTKYRKGITMLFLLMFACATNSSENEETSSNSDVPTEVSPEIKNKNEVSLNQEIKEDFDEAQENSEETSPEYITPELPAEVLATMTQKEKQVYYAMIFQRNEMPTNKTLYEDEYPLLTPDRDLYIQPKRKSLVENRQIEKKFTTEGFSETFFFDSYNSQIYGLIRQNLNSPIQAKGDIIVVADGWKGSVRWHPKSLSQCILEFQIPVLGLTLDPISLRKELGYLEHPYEWHTSWLQDIVATERQIDANKHPVISFYSTHCNENIEMQKSNSKEKEKEKTHHILFHGFLTINGVERGINIKSTITERTKDKNSNKKNSELHNYVSELELSGVFHFNHNDFNITPYSNPFLLVNNDDLITVHYRLNSSNE